MGLTMLERDERMEIMVSEGEWPQLDLAGFLELDTLP